MLTDKIVIWEPGALNRGKVGRSVVVIICVEYLAVGRSGGRLMRWDRREVSHKQQDQRHGGLRFMVV